MNGFSWSLLLKPFVFLLLVAAYYVFVIKGLRWLYPHIPRNRFVDFLFRERANRRPDYGPTAAARQRQSQSAYLEPPSASKPD
jgi:hypothetical protein